MKRPHCGELIPDNAKVCGNCGQVLKLHALPQIPKPGNPVKKKWLPTWFKWMIGIGILFVFIVLF